MRHRLSAVVVVLLMQGCIALSDFQPVGNVASIGGAWTIDGSTPTADLCNNLGTVPIGSARRAGAALVRVAFLDGERVVVHGSLIFACTNGTFDTLTGKVVAAGIWRTQLQAVDGSGHVLDVGPIVTSDASGGRIDLPPADFGSAQISASWTIAGARPSTESCTGAGIDQVELDFTGPDAPPAHVEPCATGIAGRHLHPGSYDVSLRALAGGAVVTDRAAETLAPQSGEQVMLNGGSPIPLP